MDEEQRENCAARDAELFACHHSVAPRAPNWAMGSDSADAGAGAGGGGAAAAAAGAAAGGGAGAAAGAGAAGTVAGGGGGDIRPTSFDVVSDSEAAVLRGRAAVFVGIVATQSPMKLLEDLLKLQTESPEVGYLDVLILDNGGCGCDGDAAAAQLQTLGSRGLRLQVVSRESQEEAGGFHSYTRPRLSTT